MTTTRPLDHGPAVADPFQGRRSAFGWISQQEQQNKDGEPAAPPAATPAAPAAEPAVTPPATPATPATPAATPPAATPPAATPPATPATPAAPDSTTPDPKDGTPQPPVGGVPFDQLPKDTQDEVRRLRVNDRQQREALRAAAPPEARAAVGAALGLEPEQGSDPVAQAEAAQKLTTRAETAESGLESARRENMTLRLAPDAGANADLLLDSREWATHAAGLDPSNREAFLAAMKTWVEQHPSHAASTRPPIPGSSAPQRQQGQSSTPPKPGLEGAISGAMAQQQPRQ